MDTATIIALMREAGYTSFTPEDIKKFMESINNQIGNKTGALQFDLGANGTPNKADVQSTLGSLQGMPFTSDFSNAPKLPSSIAASTLAPVQAGLGSGGGTDMSPLAMTTATENAAAIPGVDPNIMKKLRRSMWSNAIKSGIGDPEAIASQGGALLATAGMQGYPDVTATTIGSGLSGAVSGAKMGGIAGGILGAGFGATKGFIDASNKRTAMDTMRKQEEDARLMAAGVSPSIMANGGSVNMQKIRDTNVSFDSNKSKFVGYTPNMESMIDVLARDGNKYRLVRRNDGQYDYYDPNKETNPGFVQNAASWYESAPNYSGKAVFGAVSGVDNYRDYQNSFNAFTRQPSLAGAGDLVYNTAMALPVIGLGKKAVGTLIKGATSPTIVSRFLKTAGEVAGQNTIDNGYDYMRSNINSFGMPNPNTVDDISMQNQNDQVKKMADGGAIMDVLDSAGNAGVQTEIGERVVMPDGEIVLVKADKLHKDMKKDQITDFLPEGSVVFSAKDKGRMLINPKNYENQVIGYSIAKYDENDMTPQKIEEIKFGDIIGTKKLSPSEALEKIRKRFPTISNSSDIFTRATNEENKRARLPYIEILAREQEKKSGKLVEATQQFAYGGGVRVRKMANGGNAPNKTMSNIINMIGSQNPPTFGQYGQGMVVPISSAPNYSMQTSDWASRAYNDALTNSRMMDQYMPMQYAVGGYVGDPNLDPNDPYGINAMGNRLQSMQGMFTNMPSPIQPSSLIDMQNAAGLTNPNQLAAAGAQGLQLTPATFSIDRSQMAQNPQEAPASNVTLDPNRMKGMFDNLPRPSAIEPYAGLQAAAGAINPNQLSMSSLNNNTTGIIGGPQGLQVGPTTFTIDRSQAAQPMAQAQPVTQNPVDQQIKNQQDLVARLTSQGDILPFYDQALAKQKELEQLNQAEFQRNQNTLAGVNRQRQGYLAAGNLNTLLTEGMQDPTVYGRFNTPYYMNERFANTPTSVLEDQISKIRSGTNSIVAGLIDSGMSPSEAAVLAQPMIEKSLDLESNARTTFMNNQLTTDKAKYEALAKLRQDNDNELARVQQQFLVNTNAIRKEMGQATGQWFKDQKDLIENKYKQQEELRKNYLTNQQTVANKMFDIAASKSTIYENMRKAEQDRLDRMQTSKERNATADKEAAKQSTKAAEILAKKEAAKVAAENKINAATGATTTTGTPVAPTATSAQDIYKALLGDKSVNPSRAIRELSGRFLPEEQATVVMNQIEGQITDIPEQFKPLARKYALQDPLGLGKDVAVYAKIKILEGLSQVDPSINAGKVDWRKIDKYWKDNSAKIKTLMDNYPKTIEKAVSDAFRWDDLSPDQALARDILFEYGNKPSKSNKYINSMNNSSFDQEMSLMDNIIRPIKDMEIPDDYVKMASAYKYMTGRSIEDLMLYAANKVDPNLGIDKKKYDAPQVHTQEWNQQKDAVIKLMKDKPNEFKGILEKILKNENVEAPATTTTTNTSK